MSELSSYIEQNLIAYKDLESLSSNVTVTAVDSFRACLLAKQVSQLNNRISPGLMSPIFEKSKDHPWKQQKCSKTKIWLREGNWNFSYSGLNADPSFFTYQAGRTLENDSENSSANLTKTQDQSRVAVLSTFSPLSPSIGKRIIVPSCAVNLFQCMTNEIKATLQPNNRATRKTEPNA